MNWQIRLGTANRKLGPMAVVVTLDRNTCPDACPLKGNGCYAESGHMRLIWDRVSSGAAKADGFTRFKGTGFVALADELRRIAPRIPRGSIVRIGDAGDPSYRGQVSVTLIRALGDLVKRRGVRPIVYTHADPETNRAAAELASRLGFALNFSRHSLDTPIPFETTVTIAGEAAWSGSDWIRDPSAKGARDILRCPAETRSVTCSDCGLCSRARGYAIGFTVHGVGRRKARGVSYAPAP